MSSMASFVASLASSRTAADLRGARNHPTLRYVLGNGGALLLGLLVAYLALRGSVNLKQFDFFATYTGSRLVVEGHPSGLYDLHTLGHLQAALAYPWQVRGGGMPYLYPPYFALLVAPLAALPYGLAYLLWLALDCALLALIMSLLQPYAGVTGRKALLVRFGAFSSLPALVALLHGQTSILLAALLTGCFLAARSGRHSLAGVLLAFALIKPPYVLPFLVLFGVQRRWPTLLAFLATVLCLVTIPMVAYGPSIDGSYLHTLFNAAAWREQVSGFGAQSNRSFAGFLQLLLPAPAATVATLALDLAALLALVRCALRSTRIELPFGVAVIVALLIGPHVLVHDLTLLLIPAAIALRYRQVGPPHAPTILVMTYVAVAAGFGISYVLPLQLPVVAMVALGLWLVLAERPACSTDVTAPSGNGRERAQVDAQVRLS